MSDWASLLLVAWALHALHGFVWRRWPRFHFVAWTARSRPRPRLSTWSVFSFLPTGWRLRSDDVPLSLSTEGITNLPVAALARPSPLPDQLEAWRWEDIRKVESRSGHLWINGRRFAPDTGHVSAAVLRQLAAAAPTARSDRIQVLMTSWLRPLRLRRLHRVLVLSTGTAVSCNLVAFNLFALGSLYLAGGIPALLDERVSEAIARGAPWMMAYAVLLQVTALATAWRAGRRLVRHGGAPPSKTLGAVLFLPPQSFHLRALLGESLWPAMHPLSAALAFGSPTARRAAAFDVLADLHWPLPPAVEGDDLPRRIARDHRARFRPLLETVLRAAELYPETLLAAPAPDSAEACAYCPRCGDQFVKPDGTCPHRIALRPLPRRTGR